MAFTDVWITQAGAGSADGSSEANAISWATAIGAGGLSAGDLGKVVGNITLGSSTVQLANTGTAAAPIKIQGVKTGGGAYSSLRTNGGNLDDHSNFPVFTSTAASTTGWTLNNYFQMEHVNVTGTTTGNLIAAADFGSCLSMVLEQTNVNGEIAQFSNQFSHYENIDFVINVGGSSAAASKVAIDSCTVLNSRFTNPGGATGVNAFNLDDVSAAIGNQILDVEQPFIIGSSTSSVTIMNNSARNCLTFCEVKDSAASSQLVRNVAWGDNVSGGEFVKGTGSDCAITQTYNAYGNFADANQDTGDWPDIGAISLTSDPYTSSSDLRPNTTSGGGAELDATSWDSLAILGAIMPTVGGGGAGGVGSLMGIRGGLMG